MMQVRSVSRRRLLAGVAGAAGAALLAACGETAATTAPTLAATAAAPIGNTPVATTATTATTVAAPTAAATTAMTAAATVAPAATTAPATSAATTGAMSAMAPAMAGASAVEIVTSSFNAGEMHPYNVLVKRYNDSQRAVRVTHQVEPDYPTVTMKLQASLAAGKPIASITIPWNYRSYALAALGLVPLEDLGVGDLRDVLSRYNPGALASAQSGGKTLGLPFASSLPVAYWNDEITAQAGLNPKQSPPRTWDEMLLWMRTIKEKTGKNAYSGYANSWISQAFIESNGGRILDGNRPVMDAPEAVSGIGVWRSMITGLSVWATQPQATAEFAAGNTGVMVESSFNVGNYRRNAKFPFTVTEYPRFGARETRLPTGGNFLAVFARAADQRKAAWDFHTFMTSEESMKLWVTTGYLSPTNAKVDVQPGQEAAYAQIGRAVPWQEWPGAKGLEAEKVFVDNVGAAVSGQAEPQAAMTRAKNEIAGLLA